MDDPFDPTRLGEKLRKRREERDLSLSKLAERAGVSKGYLWSLEHGRANARPSGRTLYAIARELGTTMTDLLGQQMLTESPREVPDSLRTFAAEEDLSENDVQMLAGVNFRGQQPDDVESWRFIWRAIRAGVSNR
jgi:transcriptional regulator with XRE-family HTH domain